MPKRDPKPDSAELVVLSLLADGPKYGYALTKEAAGRSGGSVRLTPGVLYPLLRSLEVQGLVVASWEEVKAEEAEASAAGRKRKWYKLSAKGRRRLEQKIASHRAYRAVIDAFIGPSTGEETHGWRRARTENPWGRRPARRQSGGLPRRSGRRVAPRPRTAPEAPRARAHGRFSKNSTATCASAVRDQMLAGVSECDAVRTAVAELGDAAALARRFREAGKTPLRRTAMNLAVLGVAGAAMVTSLVAVGGGTRPATCRRSPSTSSPRS